MKIVDLIDKKTINVDLKAVSKDEVLLEMVEMLILSGKIKKQDKNEIFNKLREREELGSTGIGKGVAIPHAKSSNLKNMIAAFGISKKGVDFKSLDGAPSYIFFLLIAPSNLTGPHLKALAKISRLLDDKFIRDRLLLAKNGETVQNIIKEESEKADKMQGKAIS